MDAPVRIELFGGLRIAGAGQRVERLPLQKAASLLAYLVVHAGRLHPRDGLVEMLWPDGTLDAGRNSLSTALWTLRKALGDVGAAPDEVLEADRSGVRIRREALVTDLWEFEAALRDARCAAPAERRAQLERAVACYAGEFLVGFDDDWVYPEQVRLQDAYGRALEALAEMHREAGEAELAVEYAVRRLEVDPGSEAACLLLLRAYLAAGRPGAAAELGRRFTEHYRRRWEAEPGEPLLAALRAAEQAGAPPEPEELPAVAAAGPLALGHPRYVTRQADREAEAAITTGESVVLLKGPRQTGKTSLLARALEAARRRGARAVCTDLLALTEDQLGSLDSALRALATHLADELDLPPPADSWDADRGSLRSFRRYVRTEALPRVPRLIWGLDQVDRLFSRPYAGDILGLFRSWHNERALDPSGPWQRLTLALSYSAEAHLFVADLNQSPFNVGVRVELTDFTPAELAALNEALGGAAAADVARIHALTGGQPFLSHRALLLLRGGEWNLERLESAGAGPLSPFRDHFAALERALRADAGLWRTFRNLLRGRGRLSDAEFLRLRSAGLLRGERPEDAAPRCEMYRRYFGRD